MTHHRQLYTGEKRRAPWGGGGSENMADLDARATNLHGKVQRFDLSGVQPGASRRSAPPCSVFSVQSSGPGMSPGRAGLPPNPVAAARTPLEL